MEHLYWRVSLDHTGCDSHRGQPQGTPTRGGDRRPTTGHAYPPTPSRSYSTQLPPHSVHTHLPFCRISRCSHKMSPTKSGASSRKQSFPSAQRAAPFIQNFWKSTPFRLNSFTAHITQSRTWVSVHCRGSEGRDQMKIQQVRLWALTRASERTLKGPDLAEDVL